MSQKEHISEVVDQLLDHYDISGADSPAGVSASVPDSDKVIEAFDLLIELVLPGRSTGDLTSKEELRECFSEALEAVWELLLPEFERAIPYRWCGEAAKVAGISVAMSADEVGPAAEEALRELFSRLPKIRKRTQQPYWIGLEQIEQALNL